MNQAESFRLLYIESYDTGSHARTLDLFQLYSRHQVHSIRLPPSHWKWTTGAAHFSIRESQLLGKTGLKPAAIVLSGPMNIPAVLMALPVALRTLPVAVYFHESQWTYPTQDTNIQPFLLGHLDAVQIADRIWFNSRFHRDAFWQSATNNGSGRLHRLARTVLAGREQDVLIVYPPVEPPAGAGQKRSGSRPKRILWSARWEREKRPDRFVRAVQRLADTGSEFNLALLGPGAGPIDQLDTPLAAISHLIAEKGPLPNRAEYEAAVRQSEVIVSTTDHEFFGIAVLEAAQAGVVPVLPFAHSYPETVPSAVFYRSGDVDHLVTILSTVLRHEWGSHRPWVADARRFLPSPTVAAFDHAVVDLVTGPRRRS